MVSQGVLTCALLVFCISCAKGLPGYFPDEDVPQLEPLFDDEELFKNEPEDERVAGGATASIDEHPHQVSIRVANQTLCGGFILSNIWVMTAAHCIDGAFPQSVVVRAGSSLLASGGVLLNALSLEVHSKYNGSSNFDYDFGLIRLNGSLTFSNSIKSIAIPTQGQNLPLLGQVIITGWGVMSETAGTSSLDLKTVKVPIVPHKLCRFLYGSVAPITDRMFCAGKLIIGGRGSCQGDSGGPAVINNVAIGIASFGVTCGSPIFPSVFANIATVSAWVRGITGI